MSIPGIRTRWEGLAGTATGGTGIHGLIRLLIFPETGSSTARLDGASIHRGASAMRRSFSADIIRTALEPHMGSPAGGRRRIMDSRGITGAEWNTALVLEPRHNRRAHMEGLSIRVAGDTDLVVDSMVAAFMAVGPAKASMEAVGLGADSMAAGALAGAAATAKQESVARELNPLGAGA